MRRVPVDSAMPCADAVFHSARARLPVWRGPIACAALLVLAAGCSTRTDPGWNPYAPATGERTVLQTADDVLNVPAELLDNIDRRAENILY